MRNKRKTLGEINRGTKEWTEGNLIAGQRCENKGQENEGQTKGKEKREERKQRERKGRKGNERKGCKGDNGEENDEINRIENGARGGKTTTETKTDGKGNKGNKIREKNMEYVSNQQDHSCTEINVSSCKHQSCIG